MAKNPVGRPTKYTDDLPEKALEFIGNGKSVTQLAKHLKVAKSTIYQWAKDNEEFSVALKMANDWSQSVWEDKLEEMMTSKEVNAPLVKLYFANRFKWHDKPAEQEEETKAQSLNITFEVNEPVKDVRVTNAKSDT